MDSEPIRFTQCLLPANLILVALIIYAFFFGHATFYHPEPDKIIEVFILYVIFEFAFAAIIRGVCNSGDNGEPNMI